MNDTDTPLTNVLLLSVRPMENYSTMNTNRNPMIDGIERKFL